MANEITARRMQCDNMTFVMAAKLAMACNDRPQVRGDSQAVWDRLREVPFTVRIPEDKIDRDLETKLCAELSGILNWALAGCMAWQRGGLGKPAALVKATDGIESFDPERDALTCRRAVAARGRRIAIEI